jgi:hypothetical protein
MVSLMRQRQNEVRCATLSAKIRPISVIRVQLTSKRIAPLVQRQNSHQKDTWAKINAVILAPR